MARRTETEPGRLDVVDGVAKEGLAEERASA